MKWKESDFNSGIDKINAVLIYGPDAGLVDELCDKAIEKLEIEKDNLLALDADELRTSGCQVCQPGSGCRHRMCSSASQTHV